MEEVEEAEKRMLVLQAEVAHPPPSSLPEVGELQRQIAELIRERDFFATVGQHRSAQGSARRMFRKRHSRSDQRASNANEPPGFGRMDQQPQLRAAKRSRIRGCALDSKDWHIVEQGAASLASMNRDVPMEGKSRSTLMSSLIDEADAKRRCLDASTALMLPSRVVNQT